MPNTRVQTITRRRYLAAAGATVALPLLESLPLANTAMAATKSKLGPTSPTPRLVCMGVALSMYPGEWNPKETGKDYTAPKLIEPLSDIRSDFTLISNADHPGVTGGHRGTAAFLSGIYKPERVGQAIVIRNQITFDQLAAQTLGKDTRYQSLQFGTSDVSPADSLSWNEKGTPLPCAFDPFKIYRELFVNEKSPEQTARTMRLGRSVLDIVNEDAKLLSQNLSKSDRDRMDQYMTSVRDVEKGITRQLEWLKTPKPTVPSLGDRPTSYHQNLDLILELTALALQTNSSRVISISLPGKGMPIQVGNRRISNYHAQSHHGKDPSVVKELVEIELQHTISLAKFLQRLKSIQTTEGTLLDCTQVLFGSGLGNASSHSNRDLPVLLAGGGFKHQGHLKLPEGTPLCNLFVSMLQKLGIEADSFAGSNGNANEYLGV